MMKKLLIALLALCMAFCVCACGDASETSSNVNSNESQTAESTQSSQAESEVTSEAESEPENQATFKVTVVDEEGNPVSGVMVQICKEACIPARTDDNGIATFNVEITDGYKLSVMTCPTGYEYTGEAEIYLESGITEFTLEIQKGLDA